MVRTIMIPMDFSVASLNTLKLALDLYPFEQIKVVLIYSEYTDDSITEILFYNPKKIIDSRITPQFREALEIIKNRYEDRILNITIELFQAYDKRFLANFLDANKIDGIFIPKSYRLKTTKKSFDPVPLLRKNTLPVIELDWTSMNDQTEHEHLLALFN